MAMAALSEDDPKYTEYFRKAYEIWIQEQPTMPLTLSRKLVPFDTTGLVDPQLRIPMLHHSHGVDMVYEYHSP